MLRFKTFISLYEQLILEGRIDFLKKQYSNLPTSHDPNAEHQDSNAIVDHFADKADPTNNKLHIQWILNRYREGSIKQEDHPRIREALSNFETHKAKLPNKDLGQYKSLSDVEAAVAPHLGSAASKRQKTKAIKEEGADLLHSENGVTVHHIKTQAAACKYGSGTKWCTAGREDNKFNRYNKLGPLYVIHARDHQGTGKMKKYQFHFESGELQDEERRSIRSHDLIKHNPELLRSPIKHLFVEHYDSADKITEALNHPNPAIRQIAIRSKHATAEHITKALGDDHLAVRETAISHPNATPEHITRVLNNDKENVHSKMIAISHPNATLQNITQALGDKDERVRGAAIEHPKATAEHITNVLNNDKEEPYVKLAAIRNPNATAEHITNVLNNDKEDPYVKESAIRHPNATPEHITQVLNDKSKENAFVRRAAVQHPKATDDHIEQALNDRNPKVREMALRIKDKRQAQ